ncbi:MAG: Sensor kinase CckA [Syntrophus sp. SKADARSKE-3]|nr:Sensor kinase CckA [Syntrophus sp. SKADARSKE-3]
MIGAIFDITDLKQAEEEKRSLQSRLQRAEKMEALGTLAGGVAHDLNNVLGIVVGYSEMILDEIDEANPLRADVMKIMEGGHRSAAIVQDLLTLARRGVQTRKVFSLNTTIMDCQKTPEYEKMSSLNPKVHIKTELETDLLNIMGSPVHISKTIMNLVSNALESMNYGGMLTIATNNQSLDKPVHGYDTINVGDYVVLSITDTGEGISESDIKHIFEPFYTKKVMGRSGTGLGLAVVWGTVKDHNGYIDVQSEVGKGTTFTLYFPVTREEIAEEKTAIPLSEYIGDNESILMIDDIKEQRELAAKMLGKLNYKVKTVSSGEEAVEYLRSEKVDLIVLDMIMDPGMDGLDTYKAILEIHPKQKAIIVSGFSETERVQEAKKLGAGDYIRKPYIQEKLGMAVRQELDRK